MAHYKDINSELIRSNTDLHLKMAKMRQEHNFLNMELFKTRELYAHLKRDVQQMLMLNSSNYNRLMQQMVQEQCDSGAENMPSTNRTHPSAASTNSERFGDTINKIINNNNSAAATTESDERLQPATTEPTPATEQECILPPANSALSTQLSQTHSESTLRRQPRHVRSLSPLLNSDDDTSNEPENSESTQSIGTENVDRLAEDGDGEDDDQLDMELFTIDERSSEETSGESAQCSSIAIRTEHHVDSVPHLSCSSMQDDADDYGDAANDDDETISYIRKVLANQARQTSEHLNPSPTLRSIDPITMLHSFTINDNGSSPIDASSSAVSPTAPEPANGVTSPLRSASESTSFFTSVNASVTLLHTHDLRASTIARRTNDSRQRNAIASPAGASPMYVRHSEKVSLINDSMMSMLSAAVSSTPRQHAAEHPKRTARLAALRQARNGVQDMSTIKYSGDNDAADDYDNANVSVDPDVAAYVHPNDRWMTRLAVRISPLPPITSDASSITSSVIAGAVGRTSSILTRSRCRLLCPSHTDGSECQDKHETGALSSTTSSLVAADVTASQSRRPKRQAAPTCLLDADRKRKLRNIEGVQTRRK